MTALATGPYIPGPTGSPLLGMVGAMRRDILGMLRAGFEEYGDIVEYPLGPPRAPAALRRSAVAVFHPRDVRAVLTNDAAYSRQTPSIRALTEMFGHGLVTTEGPVWQKQRRIVQPLFTPHKVTDYAEVMQSEADALVAEELDGESGVMGLAESMERYALRVLGRTIFHEQANLDDAVTAFARLIPLVGDVVRTRATQFPRVPLSWPTKRNRRFNGVRAELYEIVDTFLDAHKPTTDGGGLLDRLHFGEDTVSGQRMTRQELRDQALIFLVAGFTTTSNALTLTLHLLGKNLRVQSQVADAAREPRAASDLHPLLLGAIKESMRLYPSAYVLARRAETDVELCGRMVRAGTNVLLSPWITHRHPEFWPDGETFDPHRFLNRRDVARYAYFPFGAGPRSCIGEHFALLEAVILLRALLSRYELRSPEGQLPLRELISMRPSGAVEVTWHVR